MAAGRGGPRPTWDSLQTRTATTQVQISRAVHFCIFARRLLTRLFAARRLTWDDVLVLIGNRLGRG